MTRRGVLGAIAAVGTSLLAGACSLLSSNTYRYRMTVEVDTPQGLRTGSSVIEVQTTEGSGIPDSSLHTKVRGEAVAVDLPNGQTLFALLRTPSDVDGAAGFAPTAYEPVLPDLRKSDTEDWYDLLEVLKRQGEPAVLPATYYPMLVRFRDIRDPKTVELVNPEALASSFGAGVRLTRIWLQITDDPVTSDIERLLPWLSTQRGALLRQTDQTPIGELPLAGRLNDGDFVQGTVR